MTEPSRSQVEPRWAAVAEESWELLARNALRRDRAGRAVVLDRAGGRPATLWPYSQVLHAAVAMSDLTGDRDQARRLGRGLERYRRGAAYMGARRPRRGARFYDDNAWVGLAAEHARLLGEEEPVQRLASRVSQWTRSGEAAGGGVRWRESRDGVHACSTGAAGLLAARLAGDRSGPTDGSELAFAARCAAFLAGPLALPSGLVADNARGGRVEPTVWAYNQGLAVGLSVQLHRSGLDGALDRARALAARTVSYFGEQDRLWRQPPCFVAVLGRMLLLLGSADGDPRWSTVVDGYLARVWERARTPDGVTGAGIGKYDREHTLDLAGVVILSALRASPRERHTLIC